MGMSSTSPRRVSITGQKVITPRDKPPAEYFTEYFICSFVFIIRAFQGMRDKSTQKHSKQQL